MTFCLQLLRYEYLFKYFPHSNELDKSHITYAKKSTKRHFENLPWNMPTIYDAVPIKCNRVYKTYDQE